ncbi:MAG: phosphatidylserine decarboxylase family protein [Hydrotalea flava]|uniref:phosphatidylserine decarboxylase family protein n=2 Tax=Chitinophagaceae TaxID=563835 RepID=UPI0009427BEE|nr:MULTISPECIES: phosphatidylserine decarboxylase family protein [Hydrotalea]MBY0348299.1 phosphatidylserine decarboxylase family protein [Hydrotalea flava]NIM36080.1 phosphatidylserine decarboxylase family protein [Hydrotalea flava]NIM38927.1 phosphatidylserine decarboxylase family protein [Hydrotalea flava]NIN04117.1 phosphatidylserine decarboxylase family protein [Hydrotalea flava]NIN15560.1 phosphatidylserine decarboxylase family protein [Hydrotalea flava]
MTIHHEGYRTIGIASLLFGLINVLSFAFLSGAVLWLSIAIFIITLILLLFIISFFRIPHRTLTIQDNAIVCPADGKVVVIEEITDTEYFKDKRIQVSIFMSPANVHVNRNPMSGEIVYNQYHKGKYLVAWHPKSSTENERWSVVVRNGYGEVLYKQIAGALAKRICNYTKVGDKVQQSAEYGFIKFGSRVDVILPLHTNIKVKLNQQVQGGVTVLATWTFNI